MSWRNELTVGILRAERIFYGTENGGFGTELSTTELGYIDGVTPGLVEAEKAVVVDENLDIGGFRNIDITGTFTVNGTTMEGTEFAVIDGVTPGVAEANKALVLDGSKDLDAALGSRINNVHLDGVLTVGDNTDGGVRGYVKIMGLYDSASGGELWIYNGENEDFDDDYYRVYADDGEFRIVGSGTGSIFGYDSSTGQIEISKDTYIDGTITAATWEINGGEVTASYSELNYNDITAAGTAQANKSVVLGGSRAISGLGETTFGVHAEDNASIKLESTHTPFGNAYMRTDGSGYFDIGVNSTYPEIRIRHTSGPDEFHLTCTQPISVGVAGTIAGRMKFLGNAASEGGWIELYNEDDADDDDDNYYLKADDGYFRFGGDSTGDHIMYRSATGQLELRATSVYSDSSWEFASTVNLAGTFQIASTTVTATGAELNYLDIASLGYGAANKAVVLDGSGDFEAPSGTWDFTNVTAMQFSSGALWLGGGAVNATGSELNTKEFTVLLSDLSAGGTAYIACPVAGTVTRVDSVVTGDPGGVSTTALNVNGGASMTATLVIANGAAAGERDTAAPADNNTVAIGDAIHLVFDATPINAVDAYVTVTVTL